MLKFTVLYAYTAGKKAGHVTTVYDTTLETDKAAAETEFARLLAEGRAALVETGDSVQAVTALPADGTVTFVLQMMGG